MQDIVVPSDFMLLTDAVTKIAAHEAPEILAELEAAEREGKEALAAAFGRSIALRSLGTGGWRYRNEPRPVAEDLSAEHAAAVARIETAREAAKPFLEKSRRLLRSCMVDGVLPSFTLFPQSGNRIQISGEAWSSVGGADAIVRGKWPDSRGRTWSEEAPYVVVLAEPIERYLSPRSLEPTHEPVSAASRVIHDVLPGSTAPPSSSYAIGTVAAGPNDPLFPAACAWMREHMPQRGAMKREVAIQDCTKPPNEGGVDCRYRTAEAAWNNLPDEIRGARGRPRKARR